ncbi:hypothetical protein CTA1_11292, partial [Colletotrichum tanaceti]
SSPINKSKIALRYPLQPSLYRYKKLPLAHILGLLLYFYQLFQSQLYKKPPKITLTADGMQDSEINAIAASPLAYSTESPVNHQVASFDLEVNLHRSNSTFSTDADSSRAALLTKLFSSALARLGPGEFRPRRGAVQLQTDPPRGLAGVSRFVKHLGLRRAVAVPRDLPYFTKPGTNGPPPRPGVDRGPARQFGRPTARRLLSKLSSWPSEVWSSPRRRSTTPVPKRCGCCTLIQYIKGVWPMQSLDLGSAPGVLPLLSARLTQQPCSSKMLAIALFREPAANDRGVLPSSSVESGLAPHFSNKRTISMP